MGGCSRAWTTLRQSRRSAWQHHHRESTDAACSRPLAAAGSHHAVGLARRAWLAVQRLAKHRRLFQRGASTVSSGAATPKASPAAPAQEEFSSCLSAAAARGDIRSLRGELLDDGLLIDAGGGSLIWPSRESSLYITAYDDRVVIKDSCDRVIEVRVGRTSIPVQSDACAAAGRMYEVDLTVTNPDFTIYLVPRTFVIDGADNWIHVGYTPESLGESYPNRWGEITLRGRYPGLWLRQDVFIQAPHGRLRPHLPPPHCRNRALEAARYRFDDWFFTVGSELVFDHPAVRRSRRQEPTCCRIEQRMPGPCKAGSMPSSTTCSPGAPRRSGFRCPLREASGWMSLSERCGVGIRV